MRAVEPVDRSERKRRGAWYTPPALVRAAGRAVGRSPRSPRRRRRLRVLDPACGDGRLLAAAAAAARAGGRRRAGGRSRSTSPRAAVARRRRARSADPVGDGRDASTRAACSTSSSATRRTSASWRAATSRGGRSAARRWALRRRGGRVPRPLAGAGPTRRRPRRRWSCRSRSCRRATRDRSGRGPGRRPPSIGFWWSPTRCSTPGCMACVLVVQSRRPQGADPALARTAIARRRPTPRPRPSPTARRGRRSWPTWPACRRLPELDCDGRAGRPRHRDRRASASSSTGSCPFVSDDGDGPALVTTGLIDVGACAWGSGRPASPAARSRRRGSTSGRWPPPIPASPPGSTGQLGRRSSWPRRRR